jgi:hypothetical protein
MGAITTKEGRRGDHHDKRRERGTSRQAHLAQKSQWPQPGGGDAPADHGSGAGGARGVKSEIVGPAAPGDRLVIEWATEL